ncbi:MAG: GH25 family lysozyme [Chloroflexota bacterium]
MTNDIRDAILSEARARQGRVYRLDPPPSASDGTIDCSLLVLEVAAAAGMALPPVVRTAEQIRQATVPIGWDEVLPGDLLFFEGTYDVSEAPADDGHVASHIGISLGAGTMRMIDAHERSGPDVAETDISGDYWQDKLFEARRLPGLASTAFPPSNEGPKEAYLRGIDVASHQGAVDWTAVAASGVTFGFTKATGGTWYRNPTFAANWLGIKAAGLVRGAYHYAFELSGASWPGDGPEAEAAYFVAELQRSGGIVPGDLLALDIEDTRVPDDEPLGDWCLRWCREVERLAGVRPFIYTGAWYSQPHRLQDVPTLRAYPLWIAAYQQSLPSVPAPWDRIAIWQHSSTGRVPGISGNVDLNVFDGSRDELLALGKPGAETGVPSEYSVGAGILAAMQARGDGPASDEVYVKANGRDAYSEAFGRSGSRYVWVGGRVIRFDPAA